MKSAKCNHLTLKNSLKVAPPLNLPRIPAPTSSAPLSASLILSGFMPDHLNFVSFFSLYTAHKMGLAASPVIHMPTKITRTNSLVSPFVHAKTKEVFESKIYKRCIQVYGGDPQVVQKWKDYLRVAMPSGIDLELESFEWKPLGYQESLEDLPPRKLSFEEDVRQRAEAFIASVQSPNTNKS